MSGADVVVCILKNGPAAIRCAKLHLAFGIIIVPLPIGFKEQSERAAQFFEAATCSNTDCSQRATFTACFTTGTPSTNSVQVYTPGVIDIVFHS